METRERISELHSAGSSRHTPKTRTVPVDLTRNQDQTGCRFSGWQLHATGQLMILLGDKQHLVLAVLDVVRWRGSGHISVLRINVDEWSGATEELARHSAPSSNTERPGMWALALTQNEPLRNRRPGSGG